jgi:parallel beta-helix repeat protein
MHGKNGSQPPLFLMLVNLLILAFSIQSVGASGTIYIRADGSIDPPTAPILRSGDIYTFTNDISSSIIVEKDNITVDGVGHALQGTGSEIGIDLSLRTNVTIQNMEIKTFNYGVYLSSSNYVTVSRTNIADSSNGIWLSNSPFNNIFENNITTNVLEGIYILASSNNSISGNNITANTFDGVYLFSSSNNTVSGNNIANNGDGVSSYYSSDNRIFHNNLISNFEQVYSESSIDIWDNGYPSGGNFWDNYTGVDEKCGPKQDHLGSDGLGDTPHVIDGSNKDNYPLMSPWTPPAGHNVAVISVVPSKNVIDQGYSGNITVYGINRGEYPETFNVTIYANTTEITSTTVPLESGSTTTITFSWTPTNTSFSKGNYTISAYAEPAPGETNKADNNVTDGWVIVAMAADITGTGDLPDGKCDAKDVSLVASLFGVRYTDPRYKPNCDIVYDGKIDARDVSLVAKNFGKKDP